jgi:hypothetical protein
MSDIVFVNEDPENGNRTRVMANQENPTRPDQPQTEFIFEPPCSVGLRFVFPDKPNVKMDQSFVCVPTRKGHCRFVYMQRFSFFKALDYIPFGGQLINWYLKYFSTKILMEDYAMLKGQQQRLIKGAVSFFFKKTLFLI